ncbi:MAG: helix-turn-helix transcriptional regulator [Oceanospirillales bacterium]|uniref:AraC family transcriptional regulator n=1 Tax=Marinobacterium halophilum TaxID=267374 RepID=A0A2P8EXD3_9GAMM|nr:AraC family transcriptional regulator [Marinobacterium halophilum]MBR9829809.1 helix-turn-helix transcriptional regulator [Oceanospirillales bacterium]PSL14128.1 AraC family transcriptional regulator [Marinobacterium halophilum]
MTRSTKVVSLPTSADHHDHQHHQLVFGLEGDTAFELAGRSREVRIGHGCLVPCATDHVFSGLGDNRILVLDLPTESHDRQQQERIDRLFQQASYFHCPPELQLLLRSLSREIDYSPHDPLLQEACSNTLICALQRQLDHALPARIQGKLNLELLDDYIDMHMDRRLPVDELAGLFCLSSSQFFARFRDQTGATPSQYVSERRLHAVRHALVHAPDSIAQLAGRFGFCNQSALTRAFSQRFEVSPAQFRRQRSDLPSEDRAKDS